MMRSTLPSKHLPPNHIVVSYSKLEANRRNGRNSRGPRSTRGKLHSRLNARTHGLSVPIAAENAAALRIAYCIIGKQVQRDLLGQAAVYAAAELDLQRIWKARLSIFAFLENPENNIGEALAHALPILLRIHRYESSAYARRKKALRRIDQLRPLSR